MFAETADRKGLPEAIIEKDFSVCWVLKQLFSIEALSDRLLFKGWDIAVKDLPCHKRFSEDRPFHALNLAVGERQAPVPGFDHP